METVDLSFVICAYNAERRLPGVLEALSRQEAGSVRWEVVVIDNASKDRTSEIAKGFEGKIAAPMRVIREDRPGLIEARRRGAREARGRYLSFIDDDNLVAPDWARQCVEFLDAHPQVGFIGGLIEPLFEDPATKPADFYERFADGLAIRELGPVAKKLKQPDSDPPPGAGLTGRIELVRLILLQVGCMLQGHTGGKLTNGEDTEMGLIAQRLGWETWYVPALRMKHVMPPARLTEGYLRKLIADGAQSGPWLDYLRGREPERSRWGYLARWALWRVRAGKMALLGMIRKRGHEHSELYPFWRNMYRSRAGGYWAMAANDPVRKLRRTLRDGANHG
ncbi:MAG: glycosyltransferase family 2 protein [Phycisphaerales bacterium]|nr:glycosyltransferase family 2 protein [Phycisphaerales bacterium]